MSGAAQWRLLHGSALLRQQAQAPAHTAAAAAVVHAPAMQHCWRPAIAATPNHSSFRSFHTASVRRSATAGSASAASEARTHSAADRSTPAFAAPPSRRHPGIALSLHDLNGPPRRRSILLPRIAGPRRSLAHTAAATAPVGQATDGGVADQATNSSSSHSSGANAFPSPSHIDPVLRQSLLSSAEAMLSHRFANPELLLSALTHSSSTSTASSFSSSSSSSSSSSWSSSCASRLTSNERLEFLGDAVLDLLVREMLVTRMLASLGLPVRAEDMRPLSEPEPLPVDNNTATNAAATASRLPFVDVASPSLLRSASVVPPAALGQLKGKHVSHHMLASLSRELGLSNVLLEANEEMRRSLHGWVRRKEQKRVAALLHQAHYLRANGTSDEAAAAAALATPPATDSDSLALLSVSDHLAEDVFEACLAALFLDMPASSASASASSSADMGSFISTPNRPALPDYGATAVNAYVDTSAAAATDVDQLSAHQPYGMAAVASFMRAQIGMEMEYDLKSLLARWLPRARRLPLPHLAPSQQQSHHLHLQQPQTPQLFAPPWVLQALRDRGEDVHANYKAQLERWVRSRYTDPSTGICHAHVLYWLRAVQGAQTFRVKVIIKLLPGGRTPRNRLIGYGRGSGHHGHKHDAAPSSTPASHDDTWLRELELLDELQMSGDSVTLTKQHHSRGGGGGGRNNGSHPGSSAPPPPSSSSSLDETRLLDGLRPGSGAFDPADRQALHEHLPYLGFLSRLEQVDAEYLAATTSPTPSLRNDASISSASKGGSSSSMTGSDSVVDILSPTAPVSFSILSASLPRFDTSFDRSFGTAAGAPVQAVAENQAAFLALEGLGLAGGAGTTSLDALAHTGPPPIGTTTPSLDVSTSAAESSDSGGGQMMEEQVPFPFASQSEYSEALDMLQSLSGGHRFRSPLLVRLLLSHSSPSSSLSFLGAGLLRFYVSLHAFQSFPHFHEGFLTRLKDQFSSKANIEHLGVRLTDPGSGEKFSFATKAQQLISFTEQAKQRWMQANGQEGTASSAPLSPLLPLLHVQHDPYPLICAGDLLEPLLGAVYLDGGFAASDRLAHLLVRPRLLALQQAAAADFPDADLGAHSYKALLQRQAQRLFGITPTLHSKPAGRGGNASSRWRSCVVIPARVFGAENAAAAVASLDAPHLQDARMSDLLTLLQHPPRGCSRVRTAAGEALAFESFEGNKHLAEGRAARHALNVLRQHVEEQRSEALRRNTAAADRLDATTSQADTSYSSSASVVDGDASGSDLRSDLHGLARLGASFATLSADEQELLRVRLRQLVLRLVDPANKLVLSAPSSRQQQLHEGTELWVDQELERDLFDTAWTTVQQEIAASSSADSLSSAKQPSRWSQADLSLLIGLLDRTGEFGSMATVWATLVEVKMVLSPAAARAFMHGFAEMGTLALLVQALRRVRAQQKHTSSTAAASWTPSRLFYERVVLRGLMRASPMWSFQQMEKLLDDMQGCTSGGKSKKSSSKAVGSRGRLMPAIPSSASAVGGNKGAPASSLVALTTSTFNHLLLLALKALEGCRLLALSSGGGSAAATHDDGAVAESSDMQPLTHSGGLGSQSPRVAAPGMVIRAADNVRARMAAASAATAVGSRLHADEVTLAILALLDALAQRVPQSSRALEELNKRLWLRAHEGATVAQESSDDAVVPEMRAMRSWLAARDSEQRNDSSNAYLNWLHNDGHDAQVKLDERMASRVPPPPSSSAPTSSPFPVAASGGHRCPKPLFNQECLQQSTEPLRQAAYALAAKAREMDSAAAAHTNRAALWDLLLETRS